jgi:hypothetical protein
MALFQRLPVIGFRYLIYTETSADNRLSIEMEETFSSQLCHGDRVTANPMSVWPDIAPVDFHSSVNKYRKYWNEFEEWLASNSFNFADFSFFLNA